MDTRSLFIAGVKLMGVWLLLQVFLGIPAILITHGMPPIPYPSLSTGTYVGIGFHLVAAFTLLFGAEKIAKIVGL